MKKVKLIPIEIEGEFAGYEDLGRREGKRWHFEFDLTPYVITCAIACGMLFATRFVQKRFFKKIGRAHV